MTHELVSADVEQGFRFRGARIVGKDRVGIDVQGVGVPDAVPTVDRTWSSHGPAVLVLGPDLISRTHSSLVHTDHTAFLRLAGEMFAAHGQMLPAGASYAAVHDAAGSDRRWPGAPV